MSQLFKRFRRDIIGLAWLSTGIFFALSLWTFDPRDPSLNTVGTRSIAENYCGIAGAFFADIFYQLMGLAAWVLALAALRMSWRAFSGKEIRISKLRLVWVSVGVLTLASLLELYFPNRLFFSGEIRIGGVLGEVFAVNLVRGFNFAGVAIILWTSAAALLVFYTERPLLDLLGIPSRWMRKLSFYKIHQLVGVLKSKLDLVAGALSRSQLPLPTQSAAPATPSGHSRFVLRNNENRKFFLIDSDQEANGQADRAEEKSSEGGFSISKIFSKEPGGPRRRRVLLKKEVERKIENWELPKLSLLEDPPFTRDKVDEREIQQKAALLVNKLEQFSVNGQVIGIRPGPAVTMYEFKPNVDVKISRITDLAEDLSLALSSESVRIIAPIPGRDVVGIETSNSVRETVYLKDILAQDEFWEEACRLPLAVGREANGTPKVMDLRKMPHLMVAGSTGSGKSVFVVSLITGLLFRHSPKTLRFILVDPKQVDLAAFGEIPHLLMPSIREPKKAISALRHAIREMEKRYRSMSRFGARGLEEFNNIVSKLTPEEVEEHEKNQEAMGQSAALEGYYFSAQPYIVIVIEEFGDLMAVDKNNVEQAVVRLAQMARACGIHLILAMQSPRKDVVTGLIKTNIPGRASFKVASKMDSRIILDESGAERLLTRGDMLFLSPGISKPERHHGPYVSDQEIAEVTAHWKRQSEPMYDLLALRSIEGGGSSHDTEGHSFEFESDLVGEGDFDDRYDEVLAWVSTQKEISVSHIQRKFRLGYPRAARMMEVFEEQGVVGPGLGSKKRRVLVGEILKET